MKKGKKKGWTFSRRNNILNSISSKPSAKEFSSLRQKEIQTILIELKIFRPIKGWNKILYFLHFISMLLVSGGWRDWTVFLPPSPP
jgi:hypothetical protein